ncbi:MAG: Clp protease N-terminal domain-containing protein [Acidimicrobiia bacterium]
MNESRFELDRLIGEVEEHHGDSALQRITEAVIVGARLSELGDDLVGHFVAEARAAGSSWADIGEAMGVTRQAAQKRFVGGRPPKSRSWSLFTRFGERPREIVRGAVSVARSMGADHVETTHLVLSLTDDDRGVTARALADTGVRLSDVRRSAGLGRSETARSGKGHVPFDAAMKKTLELSLREAIRAGKRSIGEEHILLGLLRNVGCPGERALSDNGATREDIEEWCDENLG